MIAETTDRTLIMYAGRMLESAPTPALFRQTRHPYTRALMASLPSAHVRGDTLATIPGLPPDLIAPIPGCAFAPRCTHATPACANPCELQEILPGHATACTRVQHGEIDPAPATPPA